MLLLFRRSSAESPSSLRQWVIGAFLFSLVAALLFLLGRSLGKGLQMQSADGAEIYADVNSYIFLGLTAVVVIRLFFPYIRRKQHFVNIPAPRSGGANTPLLLMSLASGIDAFLLGIGAGMADVRERAVWWIGLVVWFLLFVGAAIGAMYGRQKVQMRPRRWMALACLLLIGVAVASVVNAN